MRVMKTDPAASAARNSNEDVEVTRTIAPQERHLGVPATIGQYRIIRLIGEGGMGAVYEAEQEHINASTAGVNVGRGSL
jgi:serine/threonine protein kinase